MFWCNYMEKICVRYFKIYYLCKAKGKKGTFSCGRNDF